MKNHLIERTARFLNKDLPVKLAVVSLITSLIFVLKGPFSTTSIIFLAIQFLLIATLINFYFRTKELSLRDELTNLYNRRYFQNMLELELKRATRYQRHLSILMIDADHFKKLNDTSGHLLGDRTLKKLAGLLSDNLREVDLLARYGGEEFIVLLPDTDLKGATCVGNKLCEIVRNQLRIDSPIERLTVSVGVSSFPECAPNLEKLIHSADLALYQAKNEGRDRVVVAGEEANEWVSRFQNTEAEWAH